MKKVPKPKLYLRPDTKTYYVIWWENNKKRRHRVGRSEQDANIALLQAKIDLTNGVEPFQNEPNPKAPKIKAPTSTRSASAHEVQAELQDDKTGATLKEFKDKFFKWSKATMTRKTHKEDHVPRIDRFVRIIGEERLLSSVGTEEIEVYKADSLKERARSSVWGDIKTISSFLQKAVEWGYLAKNPAKGVKKPRLEKKPPRFLSLDERDRLLKAAAGKKSLGLIALGVFAGLRLQEIENLEWCDIDFDNKVIKITPKEGWSTKNKSARTVPLSSKLAKILKKEIPRLSKWVVCNRDGSQYSNNALRDLKKLGKLAGLLGPDGKKTFVTVHMLRHTFASHLVKKGVSVYKVSRWLGHADVKTTMIYAHLTGNDVDIEQL